MRVKELSEKDITAIKNILKGKELTPLAKRINEFLPKTKTHEDYVARMGMIHFT